jgi:hypothetical protein
LNLPLALPEIGPAPVLAFIVGAFHTSLYVLIRGSAGGRLLPLLAAATLGAYAGQALGGRLGDPLRMGDFGLLYASLMAWVGLLVVTVVGVLVPARGRS